jgi:hypothetical protein
VPRNRKKQSSAVRLVPALKAILLCVFVGGSAVGYVLQKNQVYELGRQMARREMLLERLKWENRLRANQLASLRMPQQLADRVKELGLGLVPSQAGQTIYLPDPATQQPINHAAGLYAVGTRPAADR